MESGAASSARTPKEKISTDLIDVQDLLAATRSQLSLLESYQSQLSLVHPSRVNTWNIERKRAACKSIQKWWRSRHTELAESRLPVGTTLLEERQLQEAPTVNIDNIERIILSQVSAGGVADYSELDTRLAAYYKHKSGIKELQLSAQRLHDIEQICNLLEEWDAGISLKESVSQPRTAKKSSIHVQALRDASRQWWDEEHAEKSLEECEWLERISNTL